MPRALAQFCLALVFVAAASAAAPDPVPGIISHQGRISVSNVNWTGTGRFQFSLIDGVANTVLWHHDGTATSAAQPVSIALVPVTTGLYSVSLGDITIASMTAIPASVFRKGDVRLRIWFSDSPSTPPQQLSPDIRIAPVGYAMRAAEAAAVDSTANLVATSLGLGVATANASLDVSGTTRLGDSTANYLAVSATGALTYVGGARPRRTTNLMPATANAGTATLTATAGANFPYAALVFANGGTQASSWQFIVPDSCAGGNVDVTLYWASPSTSGTCGWRVDVDSRPTDGSAAFDAALANTASQADPAPAVASAVKQVTFSGLASGWTAGRLAVVKVSRTGGTDTLGAAASLVLVKVEWIAASESD